MELMVILFFILAAAIIFSARNRWKKPSPEYQYHEERRKRLAVRDNVQHFIDSANRLIKQGKYDEASTLYLQAGKIFLAAKTKMLKGSHAAPEALEIIRNRMPLQVEKVGRNLAHEFFYNLNKPREAAAILRQMGLEGEAEAIEVVAGISPLQSVPQEENTKVSMVEVAQQKQPLEKEIPKEEVVHQSLENIPNMELIANSQLGETCLVCRRTINKGDLYLYCLNCGKAGHSRHLLEYMKVKGQCPSCKERLTGNMYQI